jgi:hypothetical protein
MIGLPCLVSQCAKLHVAGGRGQFSHAFSGEVYDFYSVSPEYFGYFPVQCYSVLGILHFDALCQSVLGAETALPIGPKWVTFNCICLPVNGNRPCPTNAVSYCLTRDYV